MVFPKDVWFQLWTEVNLIKMYYMSAFYKLVLV